MKFIARSALVFFFLASTIALAEGPVGGTPRYDRFLLPFHASVPAFTGFWRVQWWLRNDGDAPVDAFPVALQCGLPPPPTPEGPPVTIVPSPAVGARSTLSCLQGDVLPSFPIPGFIPVRDSVGAFLYVEKAREQLTVSGSVVWHTGWESAEATQLQAVPDSAFRTGTASILPITVAPNARYAVRVYALPETLDTKELTIRVFEMQPQEVFMPRERLIATISGELAVQQASLPPCRGRCDLPDVALAPAIYQFFGLPTPERGFQFQSPMRVEISPESPNVRWWALVTATDNLTQQIQLFGPSD